MPCHTMPYHTRLDNATLHVHERMTVQIDRGTSLLVSTATAAAAADAQGHKEIEGLHAPVRTGGSLITTFCGEIPVP